MHYQQVQVISGKGDGPDRFAETLRSITVDGQNRLFAVEPLGSDLFRIRNTTDCRIRLQH